MRYRRNKTHDAAERIHQMNLERNRAEFIEEALARVLDTSPGDALAKRLDAKEVSPDLVRTLKDIFSKMFDVKEALAERAADIEVASLVKDGVEKIAAEERQDAMQKAIADARAEADRPLPGLRHKTEFSK
jgi:hypothetical protein